MKTVLFIPGLGTDSRIFEQLIPLLKPVKVQIVEYKDPASTALSIRQYAASIASELEGTMPEKPIIIGMSMGGTVATELSFLMPYESLVLISTFKHRSECPLIFKIARIFPIYRLVPAFFIRATIPFFARILGICNKQEAQQLKAMLYDRSSMHFAWGRRAIVHWDNPQKPTNFIHINGTKDHIFRKANRNATHLIEGGTHNMVVDKAKEIAEIINREVLG